MYYRGAEIIEHLRQKQIEKRQEYEEEVLHKIKHKMEKIRATQQKMRPSEKPTHFDGMLRKMSLTFRFRFVYYQSGFKIVKFYQTETELFKMSNGIIFSE